MIPQQPAGSGSIAVLRRVAAVLDLDTLRHKALAAFLAATANDFAAGFARHAGPEAELIFPRALGWLISTFAHGWASMNVLFPSPCSGSGREL